ncbi:rhamnan synthesis F family protein [Asticcacaulis taihuensis]|uniref:rhamnan synthesis F family protein n=1 Tax=Asticcacaulis taihuensis TaxID=260084 RepID=UPI003F7CB861
MRVRANQKLEGKLKAIVRILSSRLKARLGGFWHTVKKFQDENGDVPDAIVDFSTAIARSVRWRSAGYWRRALKLTGMRARNRIRREQLFDHDFYTLNNPDVAISRRDPFLHYLSSGYVEGRSPSALFDTRYYLKSNEDALLSGENPLLHYARLGGDGHRNPHPLFDAKWYTAQVGTLGFSGLTPLAHYLKVGAERGLSPHPLFDAQWYLATYSDVLQTGANPLLHYLEFGWREGRWPHPAFDPQQYLELNPAARNLPVCPLVHYLTVGWRAGMNPGFLFDIQWYMALYPDIVKAGVEPLSHFLTSGWKERRSPHPLFNSQYYLTRYPDVERAGIDPWLHYLMVGWKEGRETHPLFDSRWYLRQNPDVAEHGLNPLSHYLSSGWQEGRSPHPLFSVSHYLGTYADVRHSGVEPVTHFMANGYKQGYTPCPLFDVAAYLLDNAGTLPEDTDPLSHYIQTGWREGCRAHTLFDEEWYQQKYLNAGEQNIVPLIHFLSDGWREGCNPSAFFSTRWYLKSYPDVGSHNPILHYLALPVEDRRKPHPLFDPAEVTVTEDGGFKSASAIFVDAINKSGADLVGASNVPASGEVSQDFARSVFENATRDVDAPINLFAANETKRVADYHFEFVKVSQDFSGKHVCLFAAYIPDGSVPPSTAFYLRALHEAGWEVVLIAATEKALTLSGLPNEGIAAVINKDNHGYDFASWALALTVMPSLWRAASVTFTNDSVFGPVTPDSLTEVRRAMLSAEADYVALTESFQVQHHYQSYFFMYKSGALQAPFVRKYWNDLESLSDKNEIIDRYEISALKRFEAQGIKAGVLFPLSDDIRGKDINPTLHIWRDLIKRGYPFLKVQLLRDKIEGVSGKGWQSVLSPDNPLKTVINERLNSRHERARVATITK